MKKPNKPRAYTPDEVRQMLMKQNTPLRDKLAGVVFSVLAMLDGCEVGLPAFTIHPAPDPDDAGYCQDNGMNYFDSDEDVGGSLHEIFYKHDPKREATR